MHILDKPLEIERLAFLALAMLDNSQPLLSRPIDHLEEAFKEALPRAYRLLELTEEFLSQKHQEKEAAGIAYWNSPEGRARMAEFKRRHKEKHEKPDDD